MSPRILVIPVGVSAILFCGFVIIRAQEAPAAGPVQSDCPYFGSQREEYVGQALRAMGARSQTGRGSLSSLTGQVSRMMANIAGGGHTTTAGQPHPAGSIDSYIFADFQKNGITPAPSTTDWEFIRRVTLDLTGRIPTPGRVVAFVADTVPNKRANLVEELLASPQWVDKWTMYFGDLYLNTATRPSTSLRRFPEGRNAFYQWIHDSLANGKPYNQMATELITGTTTDSYNDGASNWIINGFITGGPNQDIMDSMTANVFDTFMGIAHVNCLLCHNGRGHLDSLSLWGSQTTRYQAWQLAAYLSRTTMSRGYPDSTNKNVYYWAVQDNGKTDYALNTTSGNRPARVAPTGCKSGQPCFYVSPEYIFNGDTPRPGENYRVALARETTSDFQFARASVNYMWAQFFGRGIVDPPDTFDPARLDPNNPPPSPWTLQPSNAALLNALAQHFVASGYNLKALMREIVNSDTYQLSSRYNGEWNPAWEPYFARKFVRRLWSEEVADAVAQSSGTMPSYAMTGFTDHGYAKVSYAMQLPDVVGAPTGDSNTSALLDSFIRGNRDDQPRKPDGSILQALNLMNNNVVVQRSHASGTNASQLIVQNLNRSNTDLINTLFLTILSRLPSTDEMATAQAAIPAGGSSRTAAVQNLVWSLYNKVDFVFNY
jgi:Protein of unknown function (DUF1549)/Protein of unknown function (DUF1553)